MANCVWRTSFVVIFSLTILHSTVSDQVWSPWYNSSPGHIKTVENETLDRIAVTHKLPCARAQVVAVQCRVAGSNGTFSGQFRHQGNVLHVPCNLTGLLCRDHDQILAGTAPCADYELRVLCLVEDEASRPSDEDKDNDDLDDLGAKGGFTAMVAGGSVVIPLACVLVFQLRRYKREERQRQRQAEQAADDLARDGEAARRADAPPTYEELFGRPVSIISSGSLEEGVSEADPRRGGGERLLAPRPERLEGRVNPGASLEISESSLTSAVSSSPPAVVVASTSSSASSTSSTVSSSGSGSCQGVPGRSSTASSSTLSTSASSLSDAGAQRDSLASSTSSSTSSTSALVHASISGSDVGHRGPPPAYDWPGPGQVTVVVPDSDGGTSSPSPQPSAPPTSTSPSSPSRRGTLSTQPTSSRAVSGGRRFLGMHLSIFDLMAAIYPDPASTPPPSYDDALKILEASKQSQMHIA